MDNNYTNWSEQQQSGAYDYRASGEVAPGQDFSEVHKARKMKRSLQLLVILIIVISMLAVLLAWAVSGIVNELGRDKLPQNVPPALRPVVEETLPPDPTDFVPPVDNSNWNFIGAPATGAESAAPIAPDKRMFSLPENGRVDMSYFDTAVFVGDSLTQGLQIYATGVPNANYCAYKGISPKQMYDGSIQTTFYGVQEVPMDALAGYAPDNVYVLLGTNAMVGMSNEALLGYYEVMLDVMKERLAPEVDIYVQSITPVVQGVDRRFNFDDIAYLNNELARMAFEKGMYFLDLHEALAGEDGWMRVDYGARDGYHMNPTGYAAWVEYLVTHTANNPRHSHLYMEGHPPYSQLGYPEG